MTDLYYDISSCALYQKAIIFLAPAFCSFVCALFVLFLIWNCKNSIERHFRILASCYFLTIAVWWLSLLGYTFSEGHSLTAGIILGAAYVFIPVMFYHIVYYPLHIEGKRFSPLNYILPIPVIAVILTVVWLITPTGNRATEVAQEVEQSLSIFLDSPLGLLPAFAYCVPAAMLLARHSREVAARNKRDDARQIGVKPSQWMVVFICLGGVLLLLGVIASFAVKSSLLNCINGAAMSTQVILFTYHIIRRKYLWNVGLGNHRVRREELSCTMLENYFHVKRPYTDPEFKLTDLAEVMGVNRSEISNFINRAYGMNFKRYVNRWRLEEFRRLMALPSNERKSPYKILPLAGFSDSRHYQRALQLEKERKQYSHVPPAPVHPFKKEKTT